MQTSAESRQNSEQVKWETDGLSDSGEVIAVGLKGAGRRCKGKGYLLDTRWWGAVNGDTAPCFNNEVGENQLEVLQP